MKKITTAIDLEENTSNVIILFLLFTLIHVDATCIWDADVVCNSYVQTEPLSQIHNCAMLLYVLPKPWNNTIKEESSGKIECKVCGV